MAHNAISCLSCTLITTCALLMQSGYHNVTLLGLGSDRTTVVGRHTLLKPGVAARLELVLDVPSISTGTGSALYLDGTYAALAPLKIICSRTSNYSTL